MSSLNTLLDRAQRFAPEYSVRLSNHLPMALVALHAMGATDAQMEQGFANASRRLEPAHAAVAPSADWRALRGQPDAYPAVHAYFLRQIAAGGSEQTIRAALPWLIDGVGGNAFHGLLRTAAATVAGHDAEIASGLAHWTCSHMPLMASDAITVHCDDVTADVRAWLSELAEATAGWTKHTNGLIADRMLAYSQIEAFQRHARKLVVHHSTLRELATIALEHYLRSRNFTVLHLITGTHAMRLLLPYFDAPDIVARHYAIAFAAGVAASGIDANAAAIPVVPDSWSALSAAACIADDEHVIKLVYACREEFSATQDDRYRLAASLVLRGA